MPSSSAQTPLDLGGLHLQETTFDSAPEVLGTLNRAVVDRVLSQLEASSSLAATYLLDFQPLPSVDSVVQLFYDSRGDDGDGRDWRGFRLSIDLPHFSLELESPNGPRETTVKAFEKCYEVGIADLVKTVVARVLPLGDDDEDGDIGEDVQELLDLRTAYSTAVRSDKRWLCVDRKLTSALGTSILTVEVELSQGLGGGRGLMKRLEAVEELEQTSSHCSVKLYLKPLAHHLAIVRQLGLDPTLHGAIIDVSFFQRNLETLKFRRDDVGQRHTMATRSTSGGGAQDDRIQPHLTFIVYLPDWTKSRRSWSPVVLSVDGHTATIEEPLTIPTIILPSSQVFSSAFFESLAKEEGDLQQVAELVGPALAGLDLEILSPASFIKQLHAIAHSIKEHHEDHEAQA